MEIIRMKDDDTVKTSLQAQIEAVSFNLESLDDMRFRQGLIAALTWVLSDDEDELVRSDPGETEASDSQK